MARGTWQGSGTWQTTGDGFAKPVLIGAGSLGALLVVEWVASHAVEVLAVTAACGALAVAAVVALMRWGDRRERRHAIEHPFLTVRPAPATLTATVIPRVSQGTAAPAIEQHIHFHFDPADREAARVIRTALPGLAEGAHRQGGPT
jgi:hypothetical protein